MIFRRPAKPRPRKRDALSAQQTETGGGLTPMLYLERWGNMTNRLTPSRLSSILQAADDGDIAEQHVLFADMEDRCEHLAAEIGKRKRAWPPPCASSSTCCPQLRISCSTLPTA